METDHYDFLAVFNEAVLCFSCYIMILYTELVPSPEVRYMYGEIFLYILYVNFGLNIMLLVFEISRMVFK